MNLTIFLFMACFYQDIFSQLELFQKNLRNLKAGITYATYQAIEVSIIAHVVTIPKECRMQLIHANGQREEVSSIAKRTAAYIAINGANYRRGGKYNGNRVNLLYNHGKIYTDLQQERGAFAWDSKNQKPYIDHVSVRYNLIIDNRAFPIDACNQPRKVGMAVLYNDAADQFLLRHAPATHIIINNNMLVEAVTPEPPLDIPVGWFVYQADAGVSNICKGMIAVFSYSIEAAHGRCYTDCDFVIGGAGILIENVIIQDDQLYTEFSKSLPIVTCHDEIAADFSTQKMQELLIELRHPRTALGIAATDDLLIVVVDGRNKESVGMSLRELAQFMQQLGAVNAINMGGGGCTTLYIDQCVVNTPSDGMERPVSESLCFF